MDFNRRITPGSVSMAAMLLAALPLTCASADTLPAPPAPPAIHADDSPEAEAQLAEARKRLEEATRDVARLSEQMSGMVIDQVMPYIEGGHAIIGVQLDGTSDPHGARVREVSPGGPAAEAGLRPGDVITAINGTAIGGNEPARQVTHLLRDVKPDSQVHVRVLRDRAAHDFVVTARPGPAVFDTAVLADLPRVLPDLPGGYLFRRPLMDMELATLTPKLGSYFGADTGVLVVRAPSEGALKLEDGDVILAIDGRVPASGSHATRILSSYQPGEKISLKVMRQHKTLELETTVPEREGTGRHGSGEREHAGRPLPPPRAQPALSGNEAA
jgi:predicted metalloprotease with PDZ domain